MKFTRISPFKTLLVFVFAFIFKFAYSQDTAAIEIKIQSRKVFLDTSTQTIKVLYSIKANDTVELDSVQFNLQYSYLANTKGFVPELAFLSTSWNKKYFNTHLFAGDSFSDTAELHFNKTRMPFYFQYLELNMRDMNDSGNSVIQSAEVFVYFTPYDTIEVYNSVDFDKLQRIWNNDDSQMVALRIPAAKSNLPVSNLTAAEFNNDSLPKSFFSHPALSYIVPMALTLDTFDMEEANETEVARRADGCGNNRRRWRGTISGNLRSQVESDLGGTVNINLRNIRVRIMEKDAWPNPDDELAVVYTDNNGNFSTLVNTCQRFQGSLNDWNEENELEIYYIIEAANSSLSIVARRDYGGTRRGTWHQSSPERWVYNNGNELNHDAGQIWPDNRTVQAQLVHWANLCRDFVKSSDGLGAAFWLGDSYHPLGIKYSGNIGSSHFEPIFVDNIHIGHTSRNDENTLMHEFGHYFMYHAQEQSWAPKAKWGDHGMSFNSKTKELAWTEGWATAFGLMVDMYYHELDGEGGLEPQIHERRRTYETEPREVLRDNVANEEFTVTHGLVSEYSISCFLLDLFDNETSLRTRIGATDFQSDDGENIGDLNNGWDNIAIPFNIIVQPILEHHGGGISSENVIQNIEDYVFELAHVVSCHVKSELWPCARLNGLQNFTQPEPTQWIGSDWVRRSQTMDWDKFKWKENRNAFKFKGNEESSYFQDIQILSGVIDNFNLCIETDSTQVFRSIGHISDPLTIENGATLGFNQQELHGFYNRTTSNLIVPPQTGTFTAYISNRNTTIGAGGIMEFGDVNGTSIVNAEVCAGTIITLGQTNMALEPAKIIINDNSKLTINDGAELRISNNQQIILNGPNAVLEIKGTIRIMNGAKFTVTGGNEGFGFIRILKNYIPQNPTFLADNNTSCRVELIGNGNSDKLIEIRGTDGLYMSLPGSVWIENCKVEMESGSKFNPEINGSIVVKNTDFVAFNNIPGHRGILIPGYTRSYFSHVNVSDGQKGIQFYRGNKNTYHRLAHTNINNCSIGIESLGVDFYYDHGTISNYDHYGANLLLLSGHTRFNDVNISKSVQSISSTAIYHTSAGGSFSLLKCVINNNNIGIETWDGKVLTSCNQVTNSSDMGFKAEVTATLDMSTIGNNLLDGNDNHVLSRYDGYWTVKGGKNVLANSGSTTAKFWVSMGFNPPFANHATHTLNADQNYFHSSGSSPWTVSGSSLLEAKLLGSLSVINHDNNAGNLGTWSTNRENYCNLAPGSGGPSERTIVTNYPNDRYGSFSHYINTHLYGTIDISEALKIVSDSVNEIEHPNYVYALNAYCQVLNAHYIDSPSYAVQGTLRDAFKDKMSVFQYAMSNWSDSVNSNYDSLCYKMLSCNSALILKADSGKFPWAYMYYELYRDRSTFYRYLGDYNSAYNSIDSGKIKVSDASKSAYLEYLKCGYQGEKAMLDSLVSPDSLLFYYPCTVESTAPNTMLLNKRIKSGSNINGKYIIKPNPSEGHFEIIGNQISRVIIYNSIGQKVHSFIPSGTMTNFCRLTLNKLPTGIYSVQVFTADNNMETQKILIQR